MFHFQNVIVKDILSIDELVIQAGKTTCIVGPSGSGKTTFLRLLNLLNSPDKGTISFNGEDLAKMNSIQLRRQVIMLQQNPIIFEGTVKDNLLIGLQFAEKEPLIDDELRKFLHIVHLKSDLDEDATHLSGGEKQRLAFARVLAMKPEVLLLDEPTSALDETTAELVMKNVMNYTKQISCTVIMITHSKEIVELCTDKVIDLLNNSNSNDFREE